MFAGSHPICEMVAGASQGTLVGAEQLVGAFYPELRKLAASRMQRETSNHTWQPTVLVHELFLELTRIQDLRPVRPLDEREKAAFFALASMLMSRLLIHHTRPLQWRAEVTEVSPNLLEAQTPADQLVAIERLLERLAAIGSSFRSVVELKVFAGCSNQEIAEQMGCSERTVKRQWQFARNWLESQLFISPAADAIPATALVSK